MQKEPYKVLKERLETSKFPIKRTTDGSLYLHIGRVHQNSTKEQISPLDY